MNKRRIFLFSLIICMIPLMGMCSLVKAKSVDTVVKYSRNVYYKTNKKIKSYTVNKIEKLYEEYWNTKNKKLKKLITYPSKYGGDVYFENYTVEYYYDQNQKLVFAFAYRRKKGRIQEYRAYYGSDGKIYRFINSSGNITNFKKGKKISYESTDLKDRLYRNGTYYLHLCGDDFV